MKKMCHKIQISVYQITSSFYFGSLYFINRVWILLMINWKQYLSNNILKKYVINNSITYSI